MKIILGKQIEEIKKKNSETEKNFLKNRNSDELNEVDADDIYFHSNTIKNIKLGNNTVNRIYLNNSIVYELENTIDLNLFHSLVPNTATEIRFLYASNNPDLTDYQRIGYCDNNNFIEVWNNGTKYILINPRKNYIYAPTNCYLFLYNYTALTSCNIENFNTVNVLNMYGMFRNCSSLKNLDLNGFNTQNVTSMEKMFYECSNLTSLDVSNFNTANVTNMYDMFRTCSSLTSLDCSSFNTQNVTSMLAMFYKCISLTSIISNTFNVDSVKDASYMFSYCTALVGGNGTSYSAAHVNADYARVDGENGLPGYFTAPSANNK